MTITLLTLNAKKLNFGVRHLSTYLKSHGHHVRIIFLKPDRPSPNPAFTRQLAVQVREICHDTDIYGISLFTLDFPIAVEVTKQLRKVDTKPILWGGMHAIIDPEACIQHADYVCVDEGEQVMLDMTNALGNGGNVLSIPGLWARQNNTIYRNSVRQLEQSIDTFGIPDFEIDDMWIREKDAIRPITYDDMRESDQLFGSCHFQDYLPEKGYMYTLITSRGCPHRCTYCSNSYVLQTYRGKGKPLRFRTISHVMQELETIKNRYPFINAINIYDDDFFVRPISDLETFRDQYKQSINLPFACMVSPWSYQEDKLQILLDAGLVHTQLGVQSGSDRINYEIYNRKIKSSRTISIIHDLEKYRRASRLKNYVLDMIFDNPYETASDQLETLTFFSQLPRHVRLQYFSLVFYPKTPLTEQAIQDGLIDEIQVEQGKPMSKWRNTNSQNYTFYEFMIEFHRFIPPALFRALIHKKLFAFFKLPLFNFVFLLLHHSKAFANRIYAQFQR